MLTTTWSATSWWTKACDDFEFIILADQIPCVLLVNFIACWSPSSCPSWYSLWNHLYDSTYGPWHQVRTSVLFVYCSHWKIFNCGTSPPPWSVQYTIHLYNGLSNAYKSSELVLLMPFPRVCWFFQDTKKINHDLPIYSSHKVIECELNVGHSGRVDHVL